MSNEHLALLKTKLDSRNYERIAALNNEALYAFVADAITLCEPESVWVSTDSPEDMKYTREMAVKIGEERSLNIPGHTIHFDGMEDQGRDRKSPDTWCQRGTR
jgi:phosphoenolpyruvate carboxykinase (GTP)